MAGGIGSRFWPMSRSHKPKQFLDVLGTGKTLLQQTYERFAKICPPENILIVSNLDYRALILEQLPQILEQNVLCEPMRRNTAPCIAYANAKIALQNPNANIVVAPSDHLVLDQEKFVKDINLGLDFISNSDAILTLGITPSRPETGYGYIQVGKESPVGNGIRLVKTFTEKPNLDIAKVFVESGEFFWNSGMFLWNLQTIQNAFKDYLPEVSELFNKNTSAYNTPQEQAFIEATYSACPNISIDYGVMEHAKNVNVLCTEFGWSDLGTWGSLYENSDKNDDNNVLQGQRIITYDTQNTIVRSEGNKVAVVQGLEGYIVVDTNDVLLICKKDDEQQIKQFVNDVKIKFGASFE
jgi:mannose-1-phosphate guanylyltransferase